MIFMPGHSPLLFCPDCMVELRRTVNSLQAECPTCFTLYPPTRCQSDNMPGSVCQLVAAHHGAHIWGGMIT